MSTKPIDRERETPSSDVRNNARLTALTGAILIVLLGLMGLTVLSVRELLPQHLLLGFVLIPPVILKMGATGYRFARYYMGDAPYRGAGPPPLLLRLLGPLVVLSTVAVFVTGLELWYFGLRFGSIWVAAHQVSFMIWAPLIGIHVLAHLGRTAEATTAELRSAAGDQAGSRRSLVVASLVAGAALAAASLSYASPFIFFRDG